MSEENKAKALADLAIELHNAAAGEWGASVEHEQCLKLALTQAGFELPLFSKEHVAVDREGHTLHSLDSEEGSPIFDHIWQGEHKEVDG